MDKHLFRKNLIQLFYGKYKHHKKIYKRSDSICRISKDTLQLKISCPIASAFKKYDDALNIKDLDFLLERNGDFEKENLVLYGLDNLFF